MDMLGKDLEGLGDLADLLGIDGIKINKEIVVPLGSLGGATRVGFNSGVIGELLFVSFCHVSKKKLDNSTAQLESESQDEKGEDETLTTRCGSTRCSGHGWQ